MVSIAEALQLILSSTNGKKVKSPLSQALGKVLAQDVTAKLNSPPFDQSAMDGYAMLFEDYCRQEKIVLDNINENQAGGYTVKKIKKNTAIRIFTGARVPKNCDLVVPQELVELQDNELQFTHRDLNINANIRPAQSQFAKGDVLISKGTLLNSVHLSVIATAGLAFVEVYEAPSVGILITGNELVPVGATLKSDSIVESNSILLKGMLFQLGITSVKIVYAKDQLKGITSKLSALLKEHDVVLASGGISVGKYDFLKQALELNRVKEVFHKIKQKPGKPMFFGTKGRKLVFSLPGNPASALTCFLYYVAPALRKRMGYEKFNSPVGQYEMIESYHKKPGLTHFLKGKIVKNEVVLLPDQESYKITSFMEANCLIVIPEEITHLPAGTMVECYRF